MNPIHSKHILIWFCRITLLGGISLMIYVVTLPQYNFSHWVPHGYLKSIGAPYSLQLWLDHNLDKLAHFLGAIFILTLLYGAKFFLYKRDNLRFYVCVLATFSLIIGAELVQKWVERGFSYADILFGVMGVFFASFLIKKTTLGNWLD